MGFDTHMINWNGKSIIQKEVDMIITKQSEPEDRRSSVPDGVQDVSGIASWNISSQEMSGQYHNGDIHKQPVRDW